MAHYPDHGWRADEYTLIRGDLHASVIRAWCATDESTTPWRWQIWLISSEGGVQDYSVPEDVKRHGFRTKGEALIACERFITSIADAEQYRRAASFEGVPVPGDAEAF